MVHGGDIPDMYQHTRYTRLMYHGTLGWYTRYVPTYHGILMLHTRYTGLMYHGTWRWYTRYTRLTPFSDLVPSQTSHPTWQLPMSDGSPELACIGSQTEWPVTLLSPWLMDWPDVTFPISIWLASWSCWPIAIGLASPVLNTRDASLRFGGQRSEAQF
jgi:hypothetical protein